MLSSRREQRPARVWSMFASAVQSHPCGNGSAGRRTPARRKRRESCRRPACANGCSPPPRPLHYALLPSAGNRPRIVADCFAGDAEWVVEFPILRLGRPRPAGLLQGGWTDVETRDLRKLRGSCNAAPWRLRRALASASASAPYRQQAARWKWWTCGLRDASTSGAIRSSDAWRNSCSASRAWGLAGRGWTGPRSGARGACASWRQRVPGRGGADARWEVVRCRAGRRAPALCRAPPALRCGMAPAGPAAAGSAYGRQEPARPSPRVSRRAGVGRAARGSSGPLGEGERPAVWASTRPPGRSPLEAGPGSSL